MDKKLYKIKGLTAIFTVAVAATLIGCQTDKTAETQNTEITQNAETDNNTETQNNEIENNTDDIKEYLSQQKDKDTAAEAAISIMLDGANKLKEDATESANSENVQNELSKAMDNFQVLSDFIFNGGEIDGVTFSELSDEGKEKAKNALSSLDNTINELVPNYKERFKEWFTDKAAKGLDSLDNLKEKGLEVWDEIQSKRKTK